jgi:hypothetical protein
MNSDAGTMSRVNPDSKKVEGRLRAGGRVAPVRGHRGRCGVDHGRHRQQGCAVDLATLRVEKTIIAGLGRPASR